jgi:hypothetical protein
LGGSSISRAGDPFDEQELKSLGSMGEALCRRLAA